MLEVGIKDGGYTEHRPHDAAERHVDAGTLAAGSGRRLALARTSRSKIASAGAPGLQGGAVPKALSTNKRTAETKAVLTDGFRAKTQDGREGEVVRIYDLPRTVAVRHFLQVRKLDAKNFAWSVGAIRFRLPSNAPRCANAAE